MARRLAERDGGEVLKLSGYSHDATVGRLMPVLEQPLLIIRAAVIDHRRAVGCLSQHVDVTQEDNDQPS